MNELQLVEEALNIANQKGCYQMKESAQILHCFEVIKSKVNELEPLKEELKKANEALLSFEELNKPSEKPGPSLTKDDPTPEKKPNHK